MGVQIGIVAPASRMDDAGAERVLSLVAREYAGLAEVAFHPQCFMRSGHFAGTDVQRAEALAEVANDPAIDVVWFARGGYGSIRIVDDVLPRLSASARQKLYLGYSDLGSLLGSFYRHGVGRPVHAPMAADILRADGETAVRRTLDFLTGRLEGTLEGGLVAGEKTVAFNLTILSRLIGTEHFPELGGHVVLLEEVSEYMYNIDRTMAHLMSQAAMRRVAGIRLGRCSLVPPNEPEFGQTEVQVVEHWCRRAGIPYLGRADIGHDAGNKIVPFGAAFTS
jgi:muramoyltetrapeptide carboxypeptidase